MSATKDLSLTKRAYLTVKKLNRIKSNWSKLTPFRPTSSDVLPPYGSVKSKCPTPYDQGSIGSCTANAFCAAYKILEPDNSFEPSRMYVYAKERIVENQNSKITDSGANVTDGIDWVQKHGVCSESSWPYDISKVNIVPPASCDVDAASHKLTSYTSINVGDLDSIRACLVSGLPVLLAIGVYESFESEATATTGMVKIPNSNESFLGGHEILIVGYTDEKKLFTVLNSWGPNWGAKGFCYIPYDYISNPNLTFGLAVIQKVKMSVIVQYKAIVQLDNNAINYAGASYDCGQCRFVACCTLNSTEGAIPAACVKCNCQGKNTICYGPCTYCQASDFVNDPIYSSEISTMVATCEDAMSYINNPTLIGQVTNGPAVMVQCTTSQQLACCQGNTNLGQALCGPYWGPTNSLGGCDQIMTNFCKIQGNGSNPLCACIDSDIPNPECIDKRCKIEFLKPDL